MVAISFTSGKGGTGKTTMVLNLGAALASMGKEVVLVDADILTHSLSVLCNLEEREGLAELFLQSDFELEHAVHNVQGLPNLRVIPSSTSFELLTKMKDLLKKERLFVASRINEIAGSSEYVLIDTPAGVSREVLFSVSLGDKYCLVTETGLAELEGALIIDMLASSIGLESLGIIFNRVRTNPPEYFRRMCEEHFGKILGVIPFDIRFIETFEERSIFYLKYPTTPSSKEIRKVAEEISRRKVVRIRRRSQIYMDSVSRRILECVEEDAEIELSTVIRKIREVTIHNKTYSVDLADIDRSIKRLLTESKLRETGKRKYEIVGLGNKQRELIKLFHSAPQKGELTPNWIIAESSLFKDLEDIERIIGDLNNRISESFITTQTTLEGTRYIMPSALETATGEEK